MKSASQPNVVPASSAPKRPTTKPASRPNEKTFQYFIDLVYERCRVRLHDGKELLIRSRLEKQMRRLGLASLEDYVHFLQTQADDEEYTRVVDALTTNFTEFLRERDHFEFLIKTALPNALKPGQSKFRVWSAACSSGEEPCTLAMYLSEHYPVSEGWDWSILATDISTRVLSIASQGVYPMDRVKSLPLEWLHKYFDNGYGASAGLVRFKPELARRIEFRQLNLTESFKCEYQFEVIFCRNVMIYFDRMTQEQVVGRLCGVLVERGYLFTGHSESLNGFTVPLNTIRPSIYQNVK